MPKLPTKVLMESFEEYSKAIRKTKPNFTRFKDGNLIKNALRHISKFQIEMLFLWFLKEKIHMQPTIGAALSKGIISDFIKASRKEYGFYNKLDQLARQYANIKKGDEEIKTEAGEMVKALEKLKAELIKKVRPFSHRERAKIAEEVAAEERKQ
ncbi:MAG: hypothetical protein V1877_01445 [Candidatus Tagabacteria bacterium]